jgi:hypothetical protein
MTDEELIKHLRVGPEIVYRYVNVDHAAADRIEQLGEELELAQGATNHWIVAYNNMEDKLAKATQALREIKSVECIHCTDLFNELADAALAEIKGE